MLKEQLTAAAAAAGSSHARQALTSEDLKGWSSRIQKQAAKAVDLPYSLVRGALTSGLLWIPYRSRGSCGAVIASAGKSIRVATAGAAQRSNGLQLQCCTCHADSKHLHYAYPVASRVGRFRQSKDREPSSAASGSDLP